MAVPYLILTNFLGSHDNNLVLDRVKKLEPLMNTSMYLENGVEVVNRDIKRNQNLWLDIVDNTAMQLQEYLTKYFFNKKLLELLETKPELSHKSDNATKQFATLLSRYDAGDFYDWHVDVGGSVTWNYVCFDDNIQGGEFVLSEAEINQERKETIVIPCVNDTLIIFPAKYQHCVKSVTAGIRYSLQIFFR